MTMPIKDKVQIMYILNLCNEGVTKRLIEEQKKGKHPDLWPSEE